MAGHKPEVLVNGCVQTSAWRAPGRVLIKDKQRSRACRVEVMRAYAALETSLASAGTTGGDGEAGTGEGDRLRGEGAGTAQGDRQEESSRHSETYAEAKKRNARYAAAKRVLRGEVGEPVAAEWKLPHTFYATVGDAPFSGWIVAGDKYASFTAAGELRE